MLEATRGVAGFVLEVDPDVRTGQEPVKNQVGVGRSMVVCLDELNRVAVPGAARGRIPAVELGDGRCRTGHWHSLEAYLTRVQVCDLQPILPIRQPRATTVFWSFTVPVPVKTLLRSGTNTFPFQTLGLTSRNSRKSSVPTRLGVPPRAESALALSLAQTTVPHRLLPHG